MGKALGGGAVCGFLSFLIYWRFLYFFFTGAEQSVIVLFGAICALPLGVAFGILGEGHYGKFLGLQIATALFFAVAAGAPADWYAQLYGTEGSHLSYGAAFALTFELSAFFALCVTVFLLSAAVSHLFLRKRQSR